MSRANTGYSWQDVMLSMDIKEEARQEKKERERIQKEYEDEQSASSAWSLGLSILGVVLGFGPAGYYAGKTLGKFIGDEQYDWESYELDPGKFYKEDAEEFNRSLKKAADDQSMAQVIGTITDLASWYVSSGGMTAEKGEWDPTTWGSGDAEWSLRGKDPTPVIGEEITTLAPGPGGAFRSVDVTPVTFEGGHPSLFDTWNTEQSWVKNIGDIGSKVYKDVIEKPTAIERLAN